jgi:methylmalonyl-CoA mutase N-terminal domain/subunit
MGTLAIDPDIERQQIERVRAVRASRSADACRDALARVAAAARDGSNLVPPIVGAVEAQATVGEIADALREVFGEYKEVPSL